MLDRVAQRCRTIADSSRFQNAIFAVIVFNAVVLGLDTYDGIRDDAGDLLTVLNDACLGIFVVEVAIRIASYGRRPQDFFKEGWNVFDFVVIGAAFLPGLRQNATLLRLVRLLRVVRAVRLLPDLRVLTVAVARSIPGVASLSVITLLLVYVYAMIGWLIFHEHDPANFADVGQAMVTMFVLLTLENLPTYIETGQELSNWTLLFYISYVLLASFLIFNLFIGIVINSMEEARAIELRRAEREVIEDEGGADDEHAHDVILEERLRTLRGAVEELERELAAAKRSRGRRAV